MSFRTPGKDFNHDLKPINFPEIGGNNPAQKFFQRDELANEHNRAKRNRRKWSNRAVMWCKENSGGLLAFALIAIMISLVYVAADNNWIDENSFSTPCNGRRIHGFQNGHYVDLCIDN